MRELRNFKVHAAHAGLRPTGKPDPNPVIDAMRAHLADTRELVFRHNTAKKGN